MTANTLQDPPLHIASAVLMVDDEPHARKWFERLYGDEFRVWTAAGTDEALDLLVDRGNEVAVLLTDYRMPGRDGVALLGEVQRRHAHLARLLMSAYADKSVAVAAVNQGHVDLILEKPLDEALTRQALRDALAVSRQRSRTQLLLDQRAATLRETLGFLAHEVTAPLATVQGYLLALHQHHRAPREPVQDADAATQPAASAQGLLPLIEAAQRRTDFAQSLVSTFVQSARDASRSQEPVRSQASDLLWAVRDEYPFEAGELARLQFDAADDFALPGRRDLLFLVLCTLVKNALQALRGQCEPPPRLCLSLGLGQLVPGLPEQRVIRLQDNGPGIAPERLARLGQEPVGSEQADAGGMGLLFCRRVMTSLGGDMVLASDLGHGTTVTLFFPNPPADPDSDAHRETP